MKLFIFKSADEVATANSNENRQLGSIVKDMAMALLQIEQMVDTRFVNPPLGNI